MHWGYLVKCKLIVSSTYLYQFVNLSSCMHGLLLVDAWSYLHMVVHMVVQNVSVYSLFTPVGPVLFV